MPRFTRFSLAAALALSLPGAAFAQSQPVVPPTLTVTRLAPQLVTFAGSQVNFQNLVNGLSFGTQVQLTSVLPDGSTQVVTFTPTGPMSPSDIARTLEAARQQLISLGIAAPTAEQIGTVLMGGTLTTATGGTQVAGQLNTVPSPAAQAQTNAAIGATATPPATNITTPTTTSTSGVNVQVTPSTTTRTNTSDSLIAPGATSRSPTPSTPTPATSAPTETTASPIAGAPAATPTPPSSTQTTPPVTPATPSSPLRR